MDEITSPLIGLLGVVVGVMVQKATADKKDYMDNVTKERKEWRDKIRELTIMLNKEGANYRRLKVEFQIRLNPCKKDEDNKIIKCFDELIQEDKALQHSKKETEEIIKEINERVAYLLKHDWERAKLEANKNVFFPYGAILFILVSSSMWVYRVILRTCTSQYIKNLTSQNRITYILGILFIMACITITWRLLDCIGLGKTGIMTKLYKTFKIPHRIKYPEDK